MAATSVDHHEGAVLRRTPSASRSNLRSVPMIVAVRAMSSKVRLHRVRNPSEDFPALVTDVSQAAMGRSGQQIGPGRAPVSIVGIAGDPQTYDVYIASRRYITGVW